MQRLEVRDAHRNDGDAIVSVSSSALNALDASPSVHQWGPEMRSAFVQHHLPQSGADGVLVGEVDGAIVGVGSVRPRLRHPHEFMRIDVLPRWRRRGVGSGIYEGLLDRAPGPFFVREMLSDRDTVDFYTNRGFVTGEVATEGRIDPADPETMIWLNSRREAEVRGIAIIPTHGSGIADSEIARAVDDMYLWCHPHSPPARLSDAAATQTYLATWRRESGAAATDNGQLVGVGLLTRSSFRDDPGAAHLVWCGVRNPTQPHAEEITEALLAHCLGVARRMRWVVDVEVNHPHEDLVSLVERVPGARLFRDLTLLVSRYGG